MKDTKKQNTEYPNTSLGCNVQHPSSCFGRDHGRLRLPACSIPLPDLHPMMYTALALAIEHCSIVGEHALWSYRIRSWFIWCNQKIGCKVQHASLFIGRDHWAPATPPAMMASRTRALAIKRAPWLVNTLYGYVGYVLWFIWHILWNTHSGTCFAFL